MVALLQQVCGVFVSLTFSAVRGVVQWWWATIVVWRYLHRRAPDPVKAIAEGKLVPATRITLKVTLRG